MTAVMESEYNHLKNNILLKTSNYSTDKSHLAVLKHKYENKINSVRKFSEIDTIGKLVEILEKRDCVSRNDIAILQDIAIQTNNEIFLRELERIRMEENGENNVPVLSSNQNRSNITGSSILLQPNYDQYDVRERVYHCIITKIGNYKWLDFARNLKVPENNIDKLRYHYGDDVEKCVREVLEFHEKTAHPREHKTLLLKALEKARRNDLRNEVMKIYDDFST